MKTKIIQVIHKVYYPEYVFLQKIEDIGVFLWLYRKSNHKIIFDGFLDYDSNKQDYICFDGVENIPIRRDVVKSNGYREVYVGCTSIDDVKSLDIAIENFKLNFNENNIEHRKIKKDLDLSHDKIDAFNDEILNDFCTKYGLIRCLANMEKYTNCIIYDLGNLDNDFKGLAKFQLIYDLFNQDMSVVRISNDELPELVLDLNNLNTQQVSEVLNFIYSTINFS